MPNQSGLRSLSLERLEPRDMMSVNMSPYEQLLLELINRARANPSEEAARYGIDLNQGLAAGTISTAAKQPLAPNEFLIDAAGDHSQDMLDNNYFSHTNLAGQSPSDRARAAGYPTGAGENIAWGGSTGPINQISHVFARHENLFESPGHRRNMLRDAYEEIGLGVRFGPYTYSGTTYNSSMVTEMFGNPGIGPLLTGVVFTDASDGSANDDQFYSVGEQVGGGTITATNTSTGAVFTSSIGSSGGYALQVAPGTYDVVATAGSQSYLVTSVVVGSLNVKVDFETTTAASGGNLPPSFEPIADVQFPLTQSVFVTNLSATDPDSAQLTFSVAVENLAYHLDQSLGLSPHSSVQDNWGGLGEKWLQGEDGTSYFLTPFGELLRWDGSAPGNLGGEHVATLLSQYYWDTSLLHSAQPGMAGVVATVNGSSLSLAMDSSVRGTFVVTATVSDGVSTDTQVFHVTRGFRVTHHGSSAGLGPATARTFQVAELVGEAWHAADNAQVHSFLAAVWISDLRGESVGMIRSSAEGLRTSFDRATWQDEGGRRDDQHVLYGSSSAEQRSIRTQRISTALAGLRDVGDESVLTGVAASSFRDPATRINVPARDDVLAGWS
jgi:uncharacterized protein YkwD